MRWIAFLRRPTAPSYVGRASRDLKTVAEVDSWDSKAGREFREKAKGSVKKLEAAFKRYDAAADAFGSEVTEGGGGHEDKRHAKPKNYASDWNRAQEIADKARTEAREADDRTSVNQKALASCQERSSSWIRVEVGPLVA
ncbi:MULTISPECIES: hypothetical protein [Streptomyces]